MTLVDGVDVRFYVVGMGRSGTRWLTHALKRNDERVRVYHESFYKYDRPKYHVTANDESAHTEYVNERIEIMRAWQTENPHEAPYGEVNGYLRYCVPELQRSFGVSIAGIIRDGPKTIRSLLFHDIYVAPHSPKVLVPPAFAGDQFASCCWYWADTYRRLLFSFIPVYTLEELNEDYDRFCDLCRYVGLTVSEANWRRMAGKRVGVKINDPNPPVWNDEQKDKFIEIAGDVQVAFYH